MDPPAFKLRLTARSDRYDPDDERWLDQVGQFRRDLKAQTGAVSYLRTPVPGTKGSVDQLLLTLGSAGVFTTTVEVLRMWLGRDKRREVDCEWTDLDGTQRSVHLSAENADPETLAPLVEAVARVIGVR